DLGHDRQKAINPTRCSLQWRVRNAKFFRIPEVDAALVAELDTRVDIRQASGCATDGGIFRRPGCVGIEIEDVVILDAVVGRTPGEAVPDGLEQASGDDPHVIEAERRKTLKDDP